MAYCPKYFKQQAWTSGKKIVQTVTNPTLAVSAEAEFSAVETFGTTFPALHNANPLDLLGSLRGAGTVGASPTERGLTGWEQVGDAWFNVVGFGAVGDGTTDDTNAIQAAINAAQTRGGGVIYFPPRPAGSGIYKITNQLLTPSSTRNVMFLGPASADGSGSGAGGSRIILYTNLNRDIIQFGSSNNNISVCNLTLEMDTGTPPAAGSDGLANVPSNTVIYNVRFVGIVGSAMALLSTASFVLIDQVYVDSAAVGVTVGAADFVTLRGGILAGTTNAVTVSSGATDFRIFGGRYSSSGNNSTTISLGCSSAKLSGAKIINSGAGTTEIGLSVTGTDNELTDLNVTGPGNAGTRQGIYVNAAQNRVRSCHVESWATGYEAPAASSKSVFRNCTSKSCGASANINGASYGPADTIANAILNPTNSYEIIDIT